MKNIKKDFPWFRHNPQWTYLDSAASALKPQCVISAINDFLSCYGTNPHNVDSSLTYHVYDMVEKAREKIAKLWNTKPQNIIFNSGATEGLNFVAENLKHFLKSNDEIILTYGEHASNLLPWMEIAKQTKAKLKYVGVQNEYPSAKTIINGITNKTKIITFADVSNLTGNYINPEAVVKAVRKINKDIVVVLDAAQSVPHHHFDLSTLDVDFMAVSSNKMMGATGTGALYINQKWLSRVKPIRFGGGMNSIITKDSFTLIDGPAKFEAGSINTVGILSWVAAIDYLNKYGWKHIEKYERELTQYAFKSMARLKQITLLNPNVEHPIVLFNIKGINAQDAAAYLSQKKIIVRSGLSCAKLSDYIIGDKSAVRASLYIYNDKKDVDKLVNALKVYEHGDELKHVI